MGQPPGGTSPPAQASLWDYRHLGGRETAGPYGHPARALSSVGVMVPTVLTCPLGV